MTKKESHEQPLRVPPDIIGLIGIYFVLLPISMLGSWIFSDLMSARRSGDTTLLWIATGLGAVGTVLLFLARLPLYRERKFLQIGPAGLDATRKRLYCWAWSLIGVSIGLLVLLLAVLW